MIVQVPSFASMRFMRSMRWGFYFPSALGCWVKALEGGLGLVVHFPSGYVAKINVP